MSPEMIPESVSRPSWRFWRSVVITIPFFAVFLWALLALFVGQLAFPLFVGWLLALIIAFYGADEAEGAIVTICFGEKLERVKTEEGVYQLYWRKLR